MLPLGLSSVERYRQTDSTLCPVSLSVPTWCCKHTRTYLLCILLQEFLQYSYNILTMLQCTEDGPPGVIGHNARRLVGSVCKPATECAIVQHHTMVNTVMDRLAKCSGVMNTLVQVLRLAILHSLWQPTSGCYWVYGTVCGIFLSLLVSFFDLFLFLFRPLISVVAWLIVTEHCDMFAVHKIKSEI